MKQRAIAAGKWGIVCAALAWLILSGRLSWRAFFVAPDGWPAMAIAALLVLASLMMGFFRYWLLVRGAGIRLSLAETLRIGFIGAFFNSFLLGGIGGDAVKLVYVMRAAPRRSLAVSTVLVDRVLGLAGLLVLAGGVVFLVWSQLADSALLDGFMAWILTLLIAAGVVLVVGLLALTRGRRAAGGLTAVLAGALGFGWLTIWPHLAATSLQSSTVLLSIGVVSGLGLFSAVVVPGFLPGGGLHRYLERSGHPGRMIAGLLEAVFLFRHRLGLLSVCLLLSVVLQATGVLGLYFLGRGLNVANRPGIVPVFLAGPPALLTNCLPLPGGGLGVGEAAFERILEQLQSGPADSSGAGATLFLALRALTILLGLIGLPFYLTRPRPADWHGREQGEAASASGCRPLRRKRSAPLSDLNPRRAA